MLFTGIKITLNKNMSFFLRICCVYNVLFQRDEVLAFERMNENAYFGKTFVQRITSIFYVHITMVIEIFATDEKVYSTSLLPFPMMWFLAKSAICQFKIYGRIFSSCAYCHRDGCGLKA